MADLVDPCIKESALVVVHVGERKKDFETIQRGHLLSRTNIFSKQPVASPDDDTAAIIRILDTTADDLWYLVIYAGYLRRGSSTIQFPVNSEGHAKDEACYHVLVELCIFGGKIQDENFQDDVIDAILAKYSEGVAAVEPLEPDTIEEVYNQTMQGSPLRRLAVDMHLWVQFERRYIENDFEMCPKRFQQDFIMAVLDRLPNRELWLVQALIGGLRGNDASHHLTKMLNNIPPLPRGTVIPVTVSCCDYHLHAQGAICGNKKRKREAEEATG
ncbi:hypothetical protein CLAFUR0_12957 [Fulvia fulva]|nr:hypothetical protein CLAFUR0_12957 [Fulvia fulva]